MIARLIRWSVANRVLVLLASLGLAVWGVWAVQRTPVDAIPDLSDVQVIVRTTFPGQAPQIVENLVTYPLTTTLMSVPGAKVVRGYSFFGDSFVYVLFEDGTDLYWARSRVLEVLSQVQSRLPAAARAALGPDATGVGWIYQYALVDRSGRHDLSQLRALQDWFLRYELKAVPGVAEVATVGGMVRQYQIVLDPDRLRAYGLNHAAVVEAIARANAEAGGALLELAEAEYMVRASAYLRTLEDFRSIALPSAVAGVPVRLRDVARVQLGPELRRGIAELDGEGEVAGGIVVMRSGKNALATIAAVKAKLASLASGLPPGVEIVPVYDRSDLIERSIGTVTDTLIQQFAIVAFVCIVFLFHLRSALVSIVALPLGVLAAFVVMHYQGITANILSLGGIAIAIGEMVDASVVMVENAHRRLERWQDEHPGATLDAQGRWALVADAAVEVGPALFSSLMIITVSFVPVFALEAQEGRLFAPLAYTKSYAMAAAAGVSVTLVPVLMGWFLHGRVPSERANPLNRALIALYQPLLDGVLRFPWTTIVVAGALAAATLWPASKLGGEFMPPLDEGDLLYMPSALPGLSAAKAAELLQQTDRMIRSVPEVARVFGKAGRAETATDPAPLEMFETVIQFKPREAWRPGMTPQKLVDELDRAVKVPGLANLWVPPIRNRIDMLATGVKSPVGVKISGPDLGRIDEVAARVAAVVRDVPGVTSAIAERLAGGRYVDVRIDRTAAARHGLAAADVLSVVSVAIGGENVGEAVDGLQRFPINVRYPRDLRDSVAKLENLPVVTPRGAQIRLADVAVVAVADGPPMIKSENARPSGWVYVDIRGRDLVGAVQAMQREVAAKVALAPGMSIAWSGQYEYLERAGERLRTVVPAMLAIIFVMLYFTFRRFDEALLVMATLPFSVVGGVWLLWALDHRVSIASAVGFIGLAGVVAEFGIVMLVYLKNAWEERLAAGRADDDALVDAIREGAVLRVRPKAMTVATTVIGLAPILWETGTGSEIMQRIAAPMVGGMITAPLLSMFVIPAAWLLLRRRALKRAVSAPAGNAAAA